MVTEEGVLAVQDFNLDIKDREFIVLVGPSGCGKSTTLRMVAGLEEISGGELLIDGKRMNDVAPKGRDIAMVFQSYALYPHMTVRENMEFPLKLRKMPKDEMNKRVDEVAQILDITQYLDRKPKALSGGQRQRIGIARALAVNPEFLFCDEPISALDVSIQVQIMTLLERLQEQHGISYLFISHDLNMVRYISHRMVVMYLGAVMEEGPALDLYEFPQHPYTRALTALNGPVMPHAPIGAPLKGDPPNPLAPSKGCLFSGRCPEAEGRCFTERPPLRDWADRRIACWHI